MRRLLCCLALAALAGPAGSARAQEGAPVLVPGPAVLNGSALTQEVRNVGDAEAPAAAGTLTGAAVSDGGPRDYPAIAPGAAAASASPFGLALPAGAACGTPIDLRLALGGFEMPLRLAAGAGSTRVYTAAASVPVPDAGSATSATSAVTVGAVGPAWDVNVRLDRIAHEFAADLTLELIAPDGTAVRLADRRGGNGQDFDRTLFDDQALAPVTGAEAPFNAHLRPEQPLAALNGKAAQGEWKLRATDRSKGETGAIEGWSLELIADDCDTSTPDPEPGGTGTQAGGGSGSGGGAGAGGGAAAPGGGSPTLLRVPTLAFVKPPKSARSFRSRGVRVRIGCPDACRFRVTLLRGTRRLARTGVRELPAGEFTTLRLRPRGVRPRRGNRITVRVTSADGRSVSRSFRLRRR
jgi:subtilisin-like proprotein convertase family protein